MTCYGVRVGIRATSAEGLGAVKSWLPKALRSRRSPVVDALYSVVLGGPGPRAGVHRFHLLYRDAEQIARSLDLDQIRRAFGRDLTATISERATRRVFIHAGVVGFGGAAVLVPGRSFSGKTTLIRALVELGGVYYSDDFALLDSRGFVSPWAEPLSIRKHGAARVGESHSPKSLGMITCNRLLPVRLVVLTSYEKRRRFLPRPVPPGAGVLAMLKHTVPARLRPRAALRALTSALNQAPVVSGPRGEARSAARTILRLLSRAPVKVPPGWSRQ